MHCLRKRVYSTLVSAYGVCVLCLSLDILCVNSEELSLVILLEPKVCRKRSKHLKTVNCFIGINAIVNSPL